MTHSLPQSIQSVLQRATCLYSKDQIEQALDQMAQQITRDLADQNPIFLCVMVGALIPAAHLLMRLNFPLEIDYIHMTRYTGAFEGGQLEFRARPNISLKNRTVLILDDILDAGITLKNIQDFCVQEGASRILTAVLVDKIATRSPEGLQKADYVGLEIENHFIFGFGMDYKEYLRNAPGIYKVAPEDM